VTSAQWIAKARQMIAGSLMGQTPGVRGCRWGLRGLSFLGPNSNQSPGGCLGGCIVLVESRRVRKRRLRPQAGCL